MVDFTQYEEMKEGTKEETTVTKMNEGIQEDFRTDKYWESFEDKSKIKEAKKQPCLELETENGSRMVMTLPSGKAIHPKSNLAKFKKTYGKYPEIGMKVTTKLDENGFQRVVIEA